MSCHYFFTLKKCFFLLNFSDVNGLKSPFRAPSSFLKCQFFKKFPFKDIHCQLFSVFKALSLTGSSKNTKILRTMSTGIKRGGKT